MSRADHGIITITLNDEEYELRPTLEAYRKIQTQFGGLRGALEALTQMNVDSLTHIICAGAGIGKREQEKVAQNVFDHGISDVTEQLTPFLSALFNPKGQDDDDDEDEKKT